jgi:hypothetical protein
LPLTRKSTQGQTSRQFGQDKLYLGAVDVPILAHALAPVLMGLRGHSSSIGGFFPSGSALLWTPHAMIMAQVGMLNLWRLLAQWRVSHRRELKFAARSSNPFDHRTAGGF